MLKSLILAEFDSTCCLEVEVIRNIVCVQCQFIYRHSSFPQNEHDLLLLLLEDYGRNLIVMRWILEVTFEC